MIRIAIVEDDAATREVLCAKLDKYFGSQENDYSVKCYENALDFLDGYKADCDVVFMDIEMPFMDGMTAAEKLREIDATVLLVFVTNMQQYAAKGYAVNALDFLLKPIREREFFAMLDRVKKAFVRRQDDRITIKTAEGMTRIRASVIRYVEVHRHHLTYHTEEGDIEARGNLQDVEAVLPSNLFSRCNVCYLVSLSHILSIEADEVVVGGDRLKISRPKRKEFMADVARYFGSVR